jgi:2-polyprenyl-3-methyl-5-hydroxy-6-metoxy-1,4-benzoquinol methylase
MTNNIWRTHQEKIKNQHEQWYSYDLVQKGKRFYLTDSKDNIFKTSILYFQKLVGFSEDLLKTPLAKARVLDLGCFEGLASFAFAQKVARVVGIDGRHGNIIKARFAQQRLGLKNIDFKKEDIRNLNFASQSFDVVLALGVLYHFDAPDLFRFIENLFKWTKGITVIDTHIAYSNNVKTTYKGKDYYGIYYQESVPKETVDASIGNSESLWLTYTSLLRILKQVGYVDVYECKLPLHDDMRQFNDRVTLIATKKAYSRLPLFLPKNTKRIENFTEREPWAFVLQDANVRAMPRPEDLSE